MFLLDHILLGNESQSNVCNILPLHLRGRGLNLPPETMHTDILHFLSVPPGKLLQATSN
jgi:hypothetical protein